MDRFSAKWCEETRYFIATSPDYPGLSVSGVNSKAAIRKAKIAAEIGFEVVWKEDFKIVNNIKDKIFNKMNVPSKLIGRDIINFDALNLKTRE